MPYSLIDYYAGQMAAHFGRLPPRPGGFRPGGFRRPGGGFRRPFRRPFFPRRGPWVGPGPAPVYYETEPLCTDEWGTPIPCEPVAMTYPEPASTIDMSDVWSQQDEDELGANLDALESADEMGRLPFLPRGPRAHRRAAARLESRSQWLESEAARLRAAGRPGKAARLEKRAHRADIRSDWQTAQAAADQARRDARQALRQGYGASKLPTKVTAEEGRDIIRQMRLNMLGAWSEYLKAVQAYDNNEMHPAVLPAKRAYCETLCQYYKFIQTPDRDIKDLQAFCMNERILPYSQDGEEPDFAKFGALDDTHEVWTQDDEEDLEAMLAMPNESEQTRTFDDTHEVWSQADEEDLETMLTESEEPTPMGSACACGDVGL